MPNDATAAMLIIGNEILSGRTQDANLAYAGKFLGECGIDLCEARVVLDRPHEIVFALNELRRKYRYVFTSGGIGPTHDDITAQCVADAFGVPLEESPDAVAVMAAYYGTHEALTPTRLRMARLPHGAIPIENPITGAPGFRMINVFVLAGIPRVQRGMLESIRHQLDNGMPLATQTLRAQTGESRIADLMAATQDQYPEINIGSYPSVQDGQALVRIVCRGRDVVALYECMMTLKEQLLAQGIEHAIEIPPEQAPPDDFAGEDIEIV
jgi:molybdopterin-biosynthesis enzyme MoeA-like protein